MVFPMSRKPSVSAPPIVLPITRYQALRAQAAYLRSPTRTNGPSRWEAEEVAASLDVESDVLTESLYWSGAEKAARNISY